MSSCFSPPPAPADHHHLPSLPASSKMTPTFFIEMENNNSNNSASWRGFLLKELLYLVEFFESADKLMGRAKHLCRLQALKLSSIFPGKSFGQINDFIRWFKLK